MGRTIPPLFSGFFETAETVDATTIDSIRREFLSGGASGGCGGNQYYPIALTGDPYYSPLPRYPSGPSGPPPRCAYCGVRHLTACAKCEHCGAPT